jgi:hypothetical protein
MKTATIRLNHIFGTKNSFCADIFYRNKLLKSFDSSNYTGFGSKVDFLSGLAQIWAHENGFSDVNVTNG